MQEVERILLSKGVYIFGGYVRDKILHDHNATEYYKNLGDNINTDRLYIDSDYLPEYKDRRLLPFDIDCFTTNHDLKSVKETLISKQFTVIVKKTGKAQFYFNQNSNLDLYHTKLQIRPKIHDFLKDLVNVYEFTIDVDVIHCDQPVTKIYKELSENFDFECNSLIITPDMEYKLSYSIAKGLTPKEKTDKIQQIYDDIVHKRAVSLSITPKIRAYKMFAKEFDIITSNYHLIKNTKKYNGYCIICHGEFDNDKVCIKDPYCDAHFHVPCYLSMVSHDTFNDQCPMCKHNIYIDNIAKDTLDLVAKNIDVD